MNWKLYLIIITIFIVGVLLVFVIGVRYKDKLMNESSEINNLEDAYNFIESCNDKPFLDCDELLRRQLKRRLDLNKSEIS